MSSSTCGITIRWGPPYGDADLITEYEVFLEEYTNGWRSFDKVSVGNTTHYSTPCKLKSGRLHQFFIRSKINLHNPVKQMFVDSSRLQHIVGKYTFLSYSIEEVKVFDLFYEKLHLIEAVFNKTICFEGDI